MNIRFAASAETDQWDAKILANPDGGNVFQGDEFVEQKKLTGWTPRYIIAEELAITVHEKHVAGLGKLWYLPKGPGVTSPVPLGEMMADLSAFARKNHVFAVKMEPEIPKSDDAVTAMRELGFVPASPIQPNASTVTIDLSPDIDTVLANLNQKGRHAIRRAERDGVTVEQVETTEENARVFYDLLVATATAQGFSNSIRSFNYYYLFWRRYADANLGQMFFATFDGKVVAGAFAIIFGEKSTYKDGASQRVEGAYGVTHLLQWHVIKWAKDEGSKLHDLCGTPPSDQISNESHRWYGVGRYKTSFNKQVTDYIGAYDLVVKPFKYRLWKKYGERLELRRWWKKHNESWY